MSIKTEQEGKEIVFSFREMVAYPLMSLVGHFKDFIILTAFMSFIMTVVAVCTGRLLFCGLEERIEGVFCSSNMESFVVSFLFLICCIGFYLNRWSLISGSNCRFLQSIRQKMWRKDVKMSTIVFLYVLLWGIIFGCWYLLVVRRPSSDWIFELSYFLLFSFFILVAAFLLLNFVVFKNFISGGRFFEIRCSFWPVFDNIYKLIGCFLIYFFIFAYLYQICFRAFISELNLVSALACEYSMCFLVCVMSVILYNSLSYQEKILFRK